MHSGFLLEETTVREPGFSSALEWSAPALVTLGILAVEEQQSLHVQFWHSEDGVAWSAKPFAGFSQKFYRGTHQMAITPPGRFLQARWQLNRWGRGNLKPSFTLYLFIEPLP